MSAGPTNDQVLVAPLSVDGEEAVRGACRAQGCICGDALVVEVRELKGDEIPPEARSSAKVSAVDVRHPNHSCPLLASMTGVN